MSFHVFICHWYIFFKGCCLVFTSLSLSFFFFNMHALHDEITTTSLRPTPSWGCYKMHLNLAGWESTQEMYYQWEEGMKKDWVSLTKVHSLLPNFYVDLKFNGVPSMAMESCISFSNRALYDFNTISFKTQM